MAELKFLNHSLFNLFLLSSQLLTWWPPSISSRRSIDYSTYESHDDCSVSYSTDSLHQLHPGADMATAKVLQSNVLLTHAVCVFDACLRPLQLRFEPRTLQSYLNLAAMV